MPTLKKLIVNSLSVVHIFLITLQIRKESFAKAVEKNMEGVNREKRGY